MSIFRLCAESAQVPIQVTALEQWPSQFLPSLEPDVVRSTERRTIPESTEKTVADAAEAEFRDYRHHRQKSEQDPRTAL